MRHARAARGRVASAGTARSRATRGALCNAVGRSDRCAARYRPRLRDGLPRQIAIAPQPAACAAQGGVASIGHACGHAWRRRRDAAVPETIPERRSRSISRRAQRAAPAQRASGARAVAIVATRRLLSWRAARPGVSCNEELAVPAGGHPRRGGRDLGAEGQRGLHPVVADVAGAVRLWHRLLPAVADPAQRAGGRRLCALVGHRHRVDLAAGVVAVRPGAGPAGDRRHGADRRRRGGDQRVLAQRPH